LSDDLASPRDVLPESSRYELLVKIAAGGMATVYVGRTRGAAAGVRRTFAIKRAHAHLLDDPVFRKMFVAEARLASKIHHPNVVAVQDVEELPHELLLVMDYIEGVALADLRPKLGSIEPRLRIRATTRLVLDACAGLHAAHELRGEGGAPLAIVHRDVSPHNILVGSDGIARLTDFGIAKSAAHSSAATTTGGLKGKIGYMAPEYVETGKADLRADVFALGVVLWESLAGARLFDAPTELETLKLVARCEVDPPSKRNEGSPPSLDAVVARALARDPADRFANALELAEALEASARAADVLGSHRDVAAVVETISSDVLAARRTAIEKRSQLNAEEVESGSFAYEGHDRTATLDPTVQAPSVAPSRSRAPSAPPVDSRPPARRGLIVAGAVVAIAGGAFAASRLSAGSPPTPPALPSATVTATTAAPPVSVGSVMSTPAVPTTSAVPPSSSPASSPISTAASRPTSSPSRRAAPVDADAPPAETTAPLHAPPNPYRRDAGG